MTISTHVLVVIIGLVYPAYFIFTYKKANIRIKKDERFRLVDYKQTIFIFWMLTFLVIGNAFIDRSVSLDFYPYFNKIGIVLAALIFIFIVLQVVSSKISTIEKAESIKEKFKDIYHYLPKSRHEFIWFIFLSISAGICEEIIFRLFMFSYLLEISNLAISFILTNIIFALTHIASGKKNLLGAFILGLIFTAIYYFTNNIWLAIILHIAIDISAGVLSYYSHKFVTIHVEEAGSD